MNTPALPRFTQGLLAVLSAGVVVYAVVVYAFLPLGQFVHPRMAEVFRQNAPTVYAHVFGASVALLLGPLQFWAAFRTRRPALHRLVGKLYLGLGVGLGGIAGLILATRAQGGLAGQLGFACLALAWLYTAVHALGAAQSRDFATHRRWMIRNFALTFAAVTLRLWMPLGFALDRWPFEVVYPTVAWLCWVPNLLVAEWWLRRRPHAAAQPA
jgi:uncharacterized membrane protein